MLRATARASGPGSQKSDAQRCRLIVLALLRGLVRVRAVVLGFRCFVPVDVLVGIDFHAREGRYLAVLILAADIGADSAPELIPLVDGFMNLAQEAGDLVGGRSRQSRRILLPEAG